MNTFYKVDDKSIKSAENEMQLRFPSELRKFYKSKGYGFLDSKKENFNRLMDPLSVASFRLHKDEYENMEDMFMYDAYSDNKLVFFEVSEGLFLSIELTTKYKQRIFYTDHVIADSLEEFLNLYSKDENIIFKE